MFTEIVLLLATDNYFSEIKTVTKFANMDDLSDFSFDEYEEQEQIDEDNEELFQELAVGKAIIDMRVVPSTRKSYLRHLKYITIFCMREIPAAVTVATAVTAPSLIMPMKFKHLRLFFSMMTKPRENGCIKYKSALQAYILQRRFRFDTAIFSWFGNH